MSKTKAVKHDQEKPRMDLVPAEALVEIAKIMGMGAKKYGDHNWRSGFKWSRLYAAAQRHLTSWQLREGTDEESGLSHLGHACCCLMMLLTHEILELGEDDRWK